MSETSRDAGNLPSSASRPSAFFRPLPASEEESDETHSSPPRIQPRATPPKRPRQISADGNQSDPTLPSKSTPHRIAELKGQQATSSRLDGSFDLNDAGDDDASSPFLHFHDASGDELQSASRLVPTRLSLPVRDGQLVSDDGSSRGVTPATLDGMSRVGTPATLGDGSSASLIHGITPLSHLTTTTTATVAQNTEQDMTVVNTTTTGGDTTATGNVSNEETATTSKKRGKYNKKKLSFDDIKTHLRGIYEHKLAIKINAEAKGRTWNRREPGIVSYLNSNGLDYALCHKLEGPWKESGLASLLEHSCASNHQDFTKCLADFTFRADKEGIAEDETHGNSVLSQGEEDLIVGFLSASAKTSQAVCKKIALKAINDYIRKAHGDPKGVEMRFVERLLDRTAMSTTSTFYPIDVARAAQATQEVDDAFMHKVEAIIQLLHALNPKLMPVKSAVELKGSQSYNMDELATDTVSSRDSVIIPAKMLIELDRVFQLSAEGDGTYKIHVTIVLTTVSSGEYAAPGHGREGAPPPMLIVSDQGSKDSDFSGMTTNEQNDAIANQDAQDVITLKSPIIQGIYPGLDLASIRETDEEAIQALLLKHNPYGINVRVTKSGSMLKQLFYDWCIHFVNNLRKGQGRDGNEFVILYMDMHGSRHNSKAMTFLWEHNIVVIILPAKTSIYKQPNDNGPNKSLHTHLSNTAQLLGFGEDTLNLEQYLNVCAIGIRNFLDEEHMRLLHYGSNSATRGFQHTGLYPFRLHAPGPVQAIATYGAMRKMQRERLIKEGETLWQKNWVYRVKVDPPLFTDEEKKVISAFMEWDKFFHDRNAITPNAGDNSFCSTSDNSFRGTGSGDNLFQDTSMASAGSGDNSFRNTSMASTGNGDDSFRDTAASAGIGDEHTNPPLLYLLCCHIILELGMMNYFQDNNRNREMPPPSTTKAEAIAQTRFDWIDASATPLNQTIADAISIEHERERARQLLRLTAIDQAVTLSKKGDASGTTIAAIRKTDNQYLFSGHGQTMEYTEDTILDCYDVIRSKQKPDDALAKKQYRAQRKLRRQDHMRLEGEAKLKAHEQRRKALTSEIRTLLKDYTSSDHKHVDHSIIQKIQDAVERPTTITIPLTALDSRTEELVTTITVATALTDHASTFAGNAMLLDALTRKNTLRPSKKARARQRKVDTRRGATGFAVAVACVLDAQKQQEEAQVKAVKRGEDALGKVQKCVAAIEKHKRQHVGVYFRTVLMKGDTLNQVRIMFGLKNYSKTVGVKRQELHDAKLDTQKQFDAAFEKVLNQKRELETAAANGDDHHIEMENENYGCSDDDDDGGGQVDVDDDEEEDAE
jgi:DDE superfamily endonuclease